MEEMRQLIGQRESVFSNGIGNGRGTTPTGRQLQLNEQLPDTVDSLLSSVEHDIVQGIAKQESMPEVLQQIGQAFKEVSFSFQSCLVELILYSECSSWTE
jgi:hypothetical protein